MTFSVWQRIKSYFQPQLIEKTGSPMNPVLLVVLENNQLMLHTEKVNYSFGTLHKAFYEVLSQLSLPPTKNLNCLILGLGAGSIAQILNQKLNKPKLIGVEADAKVIALGKKWFGLQKLDIEIHETLAENFIAETKIIFDLILVDLFIDEKNASCCLDPNFWIEVNKKLAIGGKVIVNKLSGREDLDQENFLFEKRWYSVFPTFEKFHVHENVLYVGTKM